MLNFAFPYTSNEVREQFSALSRLLQETLQARRQSDFSTKLALYLAARRRFQQTLGEDDYNYFSFQLWQEGVARYTEYHIARLAASRYRPTRAFRALRDFTSFGAAEGLLLDRARPGWRNRYFTDKFFIERYFDASD